MRLPEKIKHTASRYPDCGAVSDSNLLPPEIYQKKKKKNWQEIRTFKKVSLSNHTRKQDNKKWKHFWSCRGFRTKHANTLSIANSGRKS
jgi:hypothetical protein